jgi:hypothetical protein
VRAPGEHRDLGPGVVEVLEDVAVREADLPVAVLGQPLDQLLVERGQGLAQQDREVLGPRTGRGLREA